jgi:hypothetical protein
MFGCFALGAEGCTASSSADGGAGAAAPDEGADSGDGVELLAGVALAGGGASCRAIAIWFAGATGFRTRRAIPVIASSAASVAAAGINHRGPVSHTHAPAVFFSATSASPTLLARAIAASCSRQTEQREKCKS